MQTTEAAKENTAKQTNGKEANAGPIVELVEVNKWFGSFHVLRNITLSVRRGERIVICGPSGSGKSTMIRCINRIEDHQSGRITVDGIELNNAGTRIEEGRPEG